jgi:AcrR family transcriptional regulator
MRLHAEHGILGTSFDAIAARAGTAQATVYRHFDGLAELLPACARTIHVLRELTPEEAAATFSGMRTTGLRLEVLVRGTCECYARDQGWLHAARREEELVPALEDIGRVQRDSLRILTSAALDGLGASGRTVRLVAALLDFAVWKALRVAGLDEEEATQQVLEMVRRQLEEDGIYATRDRRHPAQ